MRSITTSGFLLTALAAVVSSEELKASDVPSACTAICGPMVTLTNTCDINPDGDRRRMLRREADNDDGNSDDESDEPIEAECICKNTSFDVRSVAALCAACLSQNGGNTEDMTKIMSQCSFSSTTYIPAATTAVAGVTVLATKPAVTTGTSTTTASAAEASSAGISVFGASPLGAAAAAILALALTWL
ncbi:hypothetical protein C8A03DRAFT_16413 [Achaetomium macrosporum]|uniref:Protein CAP22 n=1 Tax=Achaetomium macrosporum TaxID=79813 RepID=A0AAN7C909_9PEZI|nr:hypothetical protein C8A03DRAFT_16413 [Achaetomium macrosporum]